jgi:hypothetical protein
MASRWVSAPLVITKRDWSLLCIRHAAKRSSQCLNGCPKGAIVQACYCHCPVNEINPYKPLMYFICLKLAGEGG